VRVVICDYSLTQYTRTKITSFLHRLLPSEPSERMNPFGWVGPYGRMTQFTANICAKDTATRATRNMFPEHGRQCVSDVFDVAVKDLSPFVVGEDAKNGAFWKARYGGCDVGRNGPSPPPPARRPSVFAEKQQPQQSSPLFPPPRWSDR
jgi:hypothetical protein